MRLRLVTNWVPVLGRWPGSARGFDRDSTSHRLPSHGDCHCWVCLNHVREAVPWFWEHGVHVHVRWDWMRSSSKRVPGVCEWVYF